MTNELVWTNLKIYRKTSKAYELQFKKNALAVDLTGWTVYFTLKLKMEDTDANAKIKKDITTHANGTKGKALIELTATDTDLPTKSYYYDIKYKDTAGNAGILIRGRITIVEPVTQRG